MSICFELPARTNLNGAVEMAQAILGHAGSPLTLDGAAVEQISTPALQVLLAAARTWREDGQPLRLHPVSEQLRDQLAVAGLTPEDISACAGRFVSDPDPASASGAPPA